VLFELIVSLVVAAAVAQLATFGTTIYLHRTVAHKSIALHPAAALFFRFSLWLTTGILTREWVAVHRKHHSFTDEEGDPHSPLLEGFWSVQLGNIYFYVRESRKKEVIEKYAKDVQDREDVWDRRLFNYGRVGPLLGTVGLCAILGVGWGLLAASIHLVLYIFVLSSSINGLCHYAGYKNFENTARNIRLLALITAGEGLHNNHHGFPRSPKFSFRRSEFDPAWFVIKLLTIFKLAKPYRTIHDALPRP
jgi:stearoyl-CoA desaturase (delta-9 desaturase)